jgi:hypothetical protein
MGKRVSKARLVSKPRPRPRGSEPSVSSRQRPENKRRPVDPPAPPEAGFSPLGSALDSQPPAGMPRWRTLDRSQNALPPTPCEALLYALAGAPGGDSVDDPIEAIAFRLVDELSALAAMADREDLGVARALGLATERARALAELIGVAKLGAAA